MIDNNKSINEVKAYEQGRRDGINKVLAIINLWDRDEGKTKLI